MYCGRIMDTTSLTSHRAGHVTPHAAAKAAADRERWLDGMIDELDRGHTGEIK